MSSEGEWGRAVDELCEAIRLTVEYVGTETLYPGEGWSWFDALSKYRPELARGFVDHHNRVVVAAGLSLPAVWHESPQKEKR